MPKRKELKGVAAALAGRFISRNNDVDGYWALGILYIVATKDKSNRLSLNILEGESSPTFWHSKRLCLPLHDLLLHQLFIRGFEEFQVISAIVEIKFDVSPTAKEIMFKHTWGEAFSCQVIITDDLNIQRTFTERGWCGKHDTKKEHQSTRAYTF
jgi:hypothetical protein